MSSNGKNRANGDSKHPIEPTPFHVSDDKRGAHEAAVPVSQV
jgi:hypothetical protein